MGNMFKKPKAQQFQPSAEQKAAERAQAEEGREQESELATRQAMKKRRAAGRGSLLTGSELGVTKDTLG